MKTIQRKETVKRVDNETADLKVKNEGWNFAPKSAWKEIRDAEKEVVKKDSGRTAPPPVQKKYKHGTNKLAGI